MAEGWCPQCGPTDNYDEDGLCNSCGATACGDGADAALAMMRERGDDRPGVRDVLAERRKQDEKWGEQNHDPFVWCSILVEEVGEWQKEALEARFSPQGGSSLARMREEAVQVAAVALAVVECIDRGRWRWGGTIVRCSCCGRSLDSVGCVLCEACSDEVKQTEGRLT